MNSSAGNDFSPMGRKNENAENRLHNGVFSSYEAILNLKITMITDKIKIVKQGVKKSDLADIRVELGLDYSVLSTILGVHERNLYIKKGDETFNKTISDKIMSIAELYSYGFEIFESKEHFNRWMNTESKAWDMKPIDLLDTYVGLEEVRNEITRLEYGIL